jgi:cell wall-associated NlpC family hydrolase
VPRRVTAIAIAAVLIAGGALYATGCGEDTSTGHVSAGAGAAANATSSRAQEVRDAESDDALIARRRGQPRVVEPQAGVLASAPETSAADTGVNSDTADPAPSSSATGGRIPGNASLGKTASASTAAVSDGIALPPISAPDQVVQIIQAGNQIARTPYLWGGGHGRWLDHGYDCSGSVSYALAAGGLLNGPLTSGQLANWGKPGKGRWVTIYANADHVFMFVAGVRFDTSGEDGRTPSRWQTDGRTLAGFTVRHPPGL